MNKIIKNKFTFSGGFTLIESIIYIAIFSLIMVGALVSIYAIISSSIRNQTKAMAQEEGSFMTGKIDWLLSDLKSFSVSPDGKTLTVTKTDTGIQSPIVLSIDGGNMFMKRGGNQSQNLNNTNVIISCTGMCFTYTKDTGGFDNGSISTLFTVSTKTREGADYSQNFTTLKFIKK